MDKATGRTLLATLLAAVGLFSGFFLWARGSQSAYAAAIPLLAGALLAVPAQVRPGIRRPEAATIALALAWVAFGLAALAGGHGVRPFAFFLLLPASLALFMLGAYLDARRGVHGLVGVAAVMVLARWSSYQAFATFQGSDSFFHAQLTDHIVANGRSAPVELASKYALTPGMHLLAASARLLTGLDTADALFWSITVAHLALPLGIFAMAAQAGRGFPAVAVVAVLAADSTILATGLNFNPVAYNLVLFLGVLLVLRRDDLRSLTAFLLMGLAAVSIHQLSVFVTALFCLTYALAHAVFMPWRRGAAILPLLQVAFLLVAAAFVNVVVGQLIGVTFVQDVLAGFLAGFAGAEVGNVDSITKVSGSVWVNLLYKFTLVTTSALAIAASAAFFIEPYGKRKAFGLAGLVVLALAFALPFVGIDLVADRWLPMALLGGVVGGGLLLSAWSPGAKVGVIVAVLGLAFVGISQPSVAHDQAFYAADRNVQEQFDEPELVAAGLLVEGDLRVFTDAGMRSLFRAHPPGEAVIALALTQLDGEVRLASPSVVLVREDLLGENRLHFGFGSRGFARASEPPLGFLDLVDLRPRVLDTGPVQAFYA